MASQMIDDVIIESIIDNLFEQNGYPLISDDFWKDVFPMGNMGFLTDFSTFFSDINNKEVILANPEFRNYIRNSDGFEQIRSEFIRML